MFQSKPTTKRSAVFDTNVRRVMYRFHGKTSDEELQAFHRSIFPQEQARAWNNAVMELGSEVCVKGTPRCRVCPWREDCTAWQRKDFETPAVQQQSTFEGSWRQYRARVLKLLMNGPMARERLGAALELPDDYDLGELLDELEEESLIERADRTIRLPG